MVVGSAPGTEAATVVPLVGGGGASDSGGGSGIVSPTAEATPPDDQLATFEFSDEEIAAAIAEAEANPVEVALPGRDTLATELFRAELAATGVDLTGVDIVVYPAGSAPSFALLSADETASDAPVEDAVAQAFLDQLLGSPTLAEFGVENLVVRQVGVDEQGSYIATMMVGIDALRSAIDSGAGLSSSDFALQVERP